MKNRKPELLLPAGNTEAFFAALAGGANAVYLGLKHFNARGRASNFSPAELAGVISVAHRNSVKVYVTLNTLVKNSEIPQLINQLQWLTILKPDAVIIQDWGVYYLIKKYFASIAMHASTQMGIHNSAGANHALQKGISRVILARELTRTEIGNIANKTQMPLEVFVHGALCYSFSGMCLYSSYIGGNSANRGNCMQVCRREFTTDSGKASLPFNLRDNQLVAHLHELVKMNIASLKIEGRLRQAEYVYKTAKTYRMALDAACRPDEALKMLETDGGREKTSWFFGNDVSGSLSENNQTGVFAGNISEITQDGFRFTPAIPLGRDCRLRVNTSSTGESVYCKPIEISGKTVTVKAENQPLKPGDKVFMISTGGFRSNEKLPSIHLRPPLTDKKLANSLRNLYRNNPEKPIRGNELYATINNVTALTHLPTQQFSAVFFSLTHAHIRNPRELAEACKPIRQKLWFSFPKFISETGSAEYAAFANYMAQSGFQQFVINHLSQRLLLPRNVKCIAGPGIQVLNDMAALLLKSEGVDQFVYSYENDYPNLISGKSRDGIVPLYFFPDLFYSRMPVAIENGKSFSMPGDKARYIKTIEDGITIVRPESPVSLFHVREKLEAKGFFRFLIDFSQAQTSSQIDAMMHAFANKEKIPGSGMFNFKLELK